jgi:hypothetical protein
LSGLIEIVGGVSWDVAAEENTAKAAARRIEHHLRVRRGVDTVFMGIRIEMSEGEFARQIRMVSPRSRDYTIGRTRILNNAQGYPIPREAGKSGFKPELIAEF